MKTALYVIADDDFKEQYKGDYDEKLDDGGDVEGATKSFSRMTTRRLSKIDKKKGRGGSKNGRKRAHLGTIDANSLLTFKNFAIHDNSCIM